MALDIIEFPTNAVPGELPATTIYDLGMIYGPLAMVPGVFSVFFYGRYKLNRKRLAEIQAGIAAKKAARAAQDDLVAEPT